VNRGVLLLPLLLVLTSCTPEGYPSNNSEMWGVVVICFGCFALIGFWMWLVGR